MTYYEPRYRRVLYFAFGAFLTLVAIPLSFDLFAKRSGFNQGQAVFNLVFASVILCCGIALIATSMRYRLTLTPDSLTLRRAFRTKTMGRSDIAGYRRVRVNGGITLLLYARGKKRPHMSFACVFKDDAAVMAWLEGIPDLNVEDYRRRIQRQ